MLNEGQEGLEGVRCAANDAQTRRRQICTSDTFFRSFKKAEIEPEDHESNLRESSAKHMAWFIEKPKTGMLLSIHINCMLARSGVSRSSKLAERDVIAISALDEEIVVTSCFTKMITWRNFLT